MASSRYLRAGRPFLVEVTLRARAGERALRWMNAIPHQDDMELARNDLAPPMRIVVMRARARGTSCEVSSECQRGIVGMPARLVLRRRGRDVIPTRFAAEPVRYGRTSSEVCPEVREGCSV